MECLATKTKEIVDGRFRPQSVVQMIQLPD